MDPTLCVRAAVGKKLNFLSCGKGARRGDGKRHLLSPFFGEYLSSLEIKNSDAFRALNNKSTGLQGPIKTRH